MKTHTLRLVTCCRCGKRSATILMVRNLVRPAEWQCRKLEACKRRKNLRT